MCTTKLKMRPLMVVQILYRLPERIKRLLKKTLDSIINQAIKNCYINFNYFLFFLRLFKEKKIRVIKQNLFAKNFSSY